MIIPGCPWSFSAQPIAARGPLRKPHEHPLPTPALHSMPVFSGDRSSDFPSAQTNHPHPALVPRRSHTLPRRFSFLHLAHALLKPPFLGRFIRGFHGYDANGLLSASVRQGT